MERMIKSTKSFFYRPIVIFLVLAINIVRPLPLMATQTIQPLFDRALEETRSGHFDQALKHWDEVIDLAPEDFVAISNKGNCLLALGDPKSAIVAESRALELRPYDSSTHLTRALAEEALSSWEDAEGDYQWILSHDPNDTSALYNLGNVKIAQGDWIVAKSFFAKAVLVDSDLPMAISSLALVNYQLDELDEAESQLRRLIRRYPMLPDSRAALTALLWKKGSIGEAESHWAAVVGLDTRYKDLDWLLNTRRWPLKPSNDLIDFLRFKYS